MFTTFPWQFRRPGVDEEEKPKYSIGREIKFVAIKHEPLGGRERIPIRSNKSQFLTIVNFRAPTIC